MSVAVRFVMQRFHDFTMTLHAVPHVFMQVYFNHIKHCIKHLNRSITCIYQVACIISILSLPWHISVIGNKDILISHRLETSKTELCYDILFVKSSFTYSSRIGVTFLAE